MSLFKRTPKPGELTAEEVEKMETTVSLLCEDLRRTTKEVRAQLVELQLRNAGVEDLARVRAHRFRHMHHGKH